jgi:hypothetical protein
MVLPAPWPITKPLLGSMVATPGLVLAHVPPLLPVVSKTVADPAHKVEDPSIVPGFPPAVTVIFADVFALPQVEVET